jgi:NADPH:quinone reductase-like Zn-dependent oxidoreductase
MEMVRSIGADHVIDYAREDFTRCAERYDLIFDCVANRSLSACRRVSSANGTCVTVGAPKLRILLSRAIKGLVLSRLVSQKFVMLMTRRNKDDLTTIRDLMQAGKVTPGIDMCYSLSEVPDAFRYLEQGHARGKVVITLEHRQESRDRSIGHD